jgi:eukaryotic-like serine/threonine-protein kinase
MAEFGAYDMAGNLKEWAANPSDDLRRYLLGGAWPEESSVFTAADSRPPFSRDHTFGFRCVRRTTPPPAEAFGSFVMAAPVVRNAPVDDATFQRFLDLHAYDKTDLEARVEHVTDASPYWRRETVSFRAGYGNERALAHLLLPKGSAPPYQIVAYLSGSGIHTLSRVEDVDEGSYQFLLRAGRAVVIPVLDGTLERGPSSYVLPVNQERVRDLRWSMDMGRSLDYLETRRDLDIRKLAFYGFSAGAMYGVRLTTLDHRFKTAVLSSGGLSSVRDKPPETDPLNFAPRVRIPVLMLNGRDDFMFPYETSQRPLFEALGTRNKVFKRYDGGHVSVLNRPDLMGEILDWFDKYLGPVNQRP